jgi:hypothetical protein
VILSPDAAARVEQVDVDYLRVRIGELARLAGNPYGAMVREAGSATAFLVEAVPNPLFNHVMGLTAGTAAELPALASWYAGHGRKLRVDVTPAQSSRELFTALADQGLSQTAFYAGLYSEVESPAEPAADGPVQIESADPDEFGRVYAEGFGFPPDRRAAMAVSVQVLAGRPDVRLYRVRVSGRTAGVGLLFLGGKTGYLATAATLPAYRRHGVHGALARHRIHHASLAGCNLIVGHAAVGSASQRSMERCGLRLAYTKAVWSAP